MKATVFEGDCLDWVTLFEDNYFDSIVTDPPYGLSFMGKDWDHGVPGTHFWKEFLRAAKPGAHLLAFGGTRTHHRLMVAIEDAGWEIRDCLMWVYGSGFPKSLDVSKAIDRKMGVCREDKFEGLGRNIGPSGNKRCETCGKWLVSGNPCSCPRPQDEPQSEAAKQWNGWGTALKPAYEIIILARKPLDGTVAQNVLKWGCGGINVDGCRVGTETTKTYGKRNGTGNSLEWSKTISPKGFEGTFNQGRFPANLIHDGSDEVLELFPHSTSGAMKKSYVYTNNGYSLGKPAGSTKTICDASEGSAARFFYCAKASKSERNIGCESLQLKTAGECTDRQENTAGLNSPRSGAGRTNGSRNHHPTVKPLALLQYLCRLITPPNGIILDPFAGSGSTGLAATREGFNSVMIEIDRGYCEIARARNT